MAIEVHNVRRPLDSDAECEPVDRDVPKCVNWVRPDFGATTIWRMRLISAVLGFALRKVAVVAGVMLSLFLVVLFVYFVVSPVREAMADQDRLEQLGVERSALERQLEALEKNASQGLETTDRVVEAQVANGRREVREKKSNLERLRKDENEVCGLVRKVLDFVTPAEACETARALVRSADRSLTASEEKFAEAQTDASILRDPDLSNQQKLERLREGGRPTPTEREIGSTEAELQQNRDEEASITEKEVTLGGFVVALWGKAWKTFFAIAILVLVLPPVLRAINYFLLLPVVTGRARPINLAADGDETDAALITAAAERTLEVRLQDGEVLTARSEHVRPVQGKVRSRLLYDWSSPFISFGAGLYDLSRVVGDERLTSATLSTPDDPDSYLMRIDFVDHPGLVMHPRHVVGVVGEPTLRTAWRWGLTALARWQVRYILFSGTGSLIVQGSGDVTATTPAGGSSRMDQHLVMGFDTRLVVGVDRTEVFWPYLRGKTPLVDDRFLGEVPFFWQKSSSDGPTNPVARAFNTLFSAVGKLLGF